MDSFKNTLKFKPKLLQGFAPLPTALSPNLPLQQRRFLSLSYSLHRYDGETSASERPPLLVMHGLFGSKQNNRSVCKNLARELKTRIYAIDLRNHGDSPHDCRHDYLSMATDIELFIEEHGLQAPILIGHSMGAKVAMTFALQKPCQVRALVAVDNAPMRAPLHQSFAKYVRGMQEIEEQIVRTQQEADKILATYEHSTAIRQFILTNLIRDPETKSMKFRVPLKILHNSLHTLGEFPFRSPNHVDYKGPTLFIRGTHSTYIPNEAIPLIGKLFPNFKLVDLESGHWVISEQPDAFRGAVIKFLSSAQIGLKN